MNEHQRKIIELLQSKPEPAQPKSYLKLELWVKEADFQGVYRSLNDLGNEADKYILHACAYGWDSTTKAVRMDSGILR